MARILLAEDYDDLREMIIELLTQQEHAVDAYNNGLAAQLALRAKPFDLLVFDWDLPEVSGVDLVRDYRAQGGKSPVLLLSGKKALSDKETGFEAGADDYLTKPFHPKELTARVKALLRRAELTTPKVSDSSDLEKGCLFADRYEIELPLGRGSTGTIYKAKQIFLNRFVAVKVLHPQLLTEADSLARFRREAQAVSSLSHPNIVSIYDFGISTGGLPYLVMDYAEGETLSHRIGESGGIALEDALPIFIQACGALAHSHERGVIHRDVKPGNMILVKSEDGKDQLKIVDFGIAKVVGGGQALQVTQNGDILGSPLYMSPEQCMGHELDLRTDVYSLGCVMFTALMGREPFVGDNVLDTMYRRTVEEVPRFASVRKDIELPQSMEAIVIKALHRERTKRYQDMESLQADLEELRVAIK